MRNLGIRKIELQRMPFIGDVGSKVVGQPRKRRCIVMVSWFGLPPKCRHIFLLPIRTLWLCMQIWTGNIIFLLMNLYKNLMLNVKMQPSTLTRPLWWKSIIIRQLGSGLFFPVRQRAPRITTYAGVITKYCFFFQKHVTSVRFKFSLLENITIPAARKPTTKNWLLNELSQNVVKILLLLPSVFMMKFVTTYQIWTLTIHRLTGIK